MVPTASHIFTGQDPVTGICVYYYYAGLVDRSSNLRSSDGLDPAGISQFVELLSMKDVNLLMVKLAFLLVKLILIVVWYFN